MSQNLQNLANLADEDIDVDFYKKIRKFCEYIYNDGPEKAIETGEALSGSG